MDSPQVQHSGSENSENTETPNGNLVLDELAAKVIEVVDGEMVGANTEPKFKPTEDAVLLQTQPSLEAPTKMNISYLTSPMVELLVGEGENKTVLAAHQNLLAQSPLLADHINKFNASGPRRIELPGEDVEAFTCFLEFQYSHEYSLGEEKEPHAESKTTVYGTDDSGEQLLRHARVYTLAEKLKLPALKRLAHAKIHRIKSTPSGEMAYARYIYTHTAENDSIRKPVAAHWATNGHAMRHDLEDAFKELCIEVPAFTFDVLDIVMGRTAHKPGPGKKRRRDN
ncbi:hypothetical protein N7495_008855 [Penicillium taxi]|uniref:uncharacterized protein n=1 Tax=Penicillium taxi TaxID=168475 RepID=UPI0025456033|nr:uncharacterized protein N7495_008855 [Penicillium taxi]KAJ5888814.1 hypothetical protein N7495_008855 [Penicillium taxi]